MSEVSVKMPAEWAGQSIDPWVEPWYRFSRVLGTVLPFLPSQEKLRWLDAGCQMGQFLSLVRNNVDSETSGVDDFPRDNVIEVCEKYLNLKINHPDEVLAGWHYEPRQIDQQGLGFDRPFDVVSALELIEHMIDTDAFFEECHKTLVPGGLLLLSTPNINSLRNRITVPLGIYPTGMEYRNQIHHVRLYNADVLKAQAASHGFELLSLKGVSWLPARWLRQPQSRLIDRFLSDHLPRFSGNLIGVFRKF